MRLSQVLIVLWIHINKKTIPENHDGFWDSFNLQ